MGFKRPIQQGIITLKNRIQVLQKVADAELETRE